MTWGFSGSSSPSKSSSRSNQDIQIHIESPLQPFGHSPSTERPPSTPLLHSRFRDSYTTSASLYSHGDPSAEPSRTSVFDIDDDASVYSVQSGLAHPGRTSRSIARASSQLLPPGVLDQEGYRRSNQSMLEIQQPTSAKFYSSDETPPFNSPGYSDSDVAYGGVTVQDSNNHSLTEDNVDLPVNFSRPRRPTIPARPSEEHKRLVLERNSHRGASPSNMSSPHLSPNASPSTFYSPSSPSYPSISPRDDHYFNSAQGNVTKMSNLALFPPSDRARSPNASGELLSPHWESSRSPGSPYNSQQELRQPSASVSSNDQFTAPAVQTRPSSPSASSHTAEEYLRMGITSHEADRLTESANYFQKSATGGGCAVGMLMWGLSLRHGWGCDKDEKAAFRWLRQAAEVAVGKLEVAREGRDALKSELVLAVYEVGQCFFQGWGVPRDKQMAVSYFQTAARMGDPDAQQDLAFCLANGKGCKKDRKEAAKWYRAAAAQGASTVGLTWIYKPKYAD